MASFTVTSLTLSITETVWWRRQLEGDNKNKSQMFSWGRLPVSCVLLASVQAAEKRKKSPASSFFLKACLSFFGLYLCLKWRIAIVRAHLLLRYIWNDLKGRWYSEDYPQWSPSPQTGCGTEGEGAKNTDGADSVLTISLLTLEQEDAALAASQNRTVFPWLV